MCIFHLGTASFSCHRVLGALCRLFSYSVPIQPLSCLMADEQGCQISKKPPFHFLVYLFQEYKPVTCWPFVHIRPNGSSIRTKLKLSKQVFSLILSCDNPACLPSPRWCVKVTRALGCRLIQHFVSLGWSLGRQICPGKKFARLLQQPSSVSLLSLSRSLCLSLSLSLSLFFLSLKPVFWSLGRRGKLWSPMPRASRSWCRQPGWPNIYDWYVLTSLSRPF
jgi:hypothetical protein